VGKAVKSRKFVATNSKATPVKPLEQE